MKKYIVGGLAGFTLATALSAHAEISSILGKPVSALYNVSVNGNSLDVPAIMVDDRTFLPVRAFGEATGYTVSFDERLGVMMTKVQPSPTPTHAPASTPVSSPAPSPGQTVSKEEKIAKLLEKIKYNYSMITATQRAMEIDLTEEFFHAGNRKITEYQNEIAQYQKELGELTNQP
ncbi:stalk domain-containing protein [Gorillibacterium sp. sgz5001074]|uniref:stalk domain-containing protein n=1 Tax=Gorillibacterium sp. sgz5001074 TaxID=3446695 RepID=UPI003F67B378